MIALQRRRRGLPPGRLQRLVLEALRGSHRRALQDDATLPVRAVGRPGGGTAREEAAG